MSKYLCLTIFIAFLSILHLQTLAQQPIAVIEGVLDLHAAPDTTSVYIGKNISDNLDEHEKWNTIVGTNSGPKITSGHYNTFFGFGAGAKITTGLGNTLLGMSAGGKETTGEENTYLGTDVARNIQSGYYNTMIGSLAGSGITTGSGNTFLGRSCGGGISSGSENIVVGVGAGPVTSGAYNERFYLDVKRSDSPLLYGEFDNDLLRVNGDFQISDGLTNMIHIGSESDTSGYYWSEDADEKSFGLIYDGTGLFEENKLHLREFFGDDHENMVTFKGDGKVGIGQTSPVVPLHVEGGTDANETVGGYFQVGTGTDLNMVMDNNEIMARDNGSQSKLFLNIGENTNGQGGANVHLGGRVIVGDNDSGDGAGQIRYNLTADDFEGRTGSGWKSLTNKKIYTVNIGPGAWTTSDPDFDRISVRVIDGGETRSTSSTNPIDFMHMPLNLPEGSILHGITYYFRNFSAMQPPIEFSLFGFHSNGNPALTTETHIETGSVGVGYQAKEVVESLTIAPNKMYMVQVKTEPDAGVNYLTQIAVLGVQIKYSLP